MSGVPSEGMGEFGPSPCQGARRGQNYGGGVRVHHRRGDIEQYYRTNGGLDRAPSINDVRNY